MEIVEKICDSLPLDSELLKFERLVGSKLPEDYRSFLLSHNGGRPKPEAFSFPTKHGARDNSVVEYFFGLHLGRIGSLEKKRAMYKDRIPEGFIPIAIDPFGNLILMGTRDENHGNIFFWDHEMESDLPSLKNVSFVTDSFADFISRLEESA
jgi:hypothetical protein